MRPVLIPEEMAALDRAAPAPVEVLIQRAGRALARSALEMLGGAYGRRVVVVAGKGNNGADGWAAAETLRRRGVAVEVLEAASAPARLPACDLVLDAAYGTGLRGSYEAPDPGGAPVLAVDIPSGVDGLTGVAAGHPAQARRTVTFAALKPGLLFADGARLAGEVVLADIGLDASSATAWLCDAGDVAGWLPVRARDAHKWRSGLVVAAGGAGMTGAAWLVAAAAQRAGAGMVRLGSPGLGQDSLRPVEAVGVELPLEGWAEPLLLALERAQALAIGPGLGRAPATMEAVGQVVASARVPVVVDGDGLTALGRDAGRLVGRRRAATVLTPHDGEAASLGARPGPDRLGSARALAAETGAVVLLKGPTTVVAEPAGRCVLVDIGDERLATAGTGDVLTGTVGGLLAAGAPALEAAAAGAWLHGAAARLGHRHGLVASDLVELLPLAIADAHRAATSDDAVRGGAEPGAHR